MEANDFMNEAIRLAEEGMSRGDGGPFGAVVVRDGRIIGRGWNCVTSLNDPTAHAEVMAIRDACRTLADFQLTGCDIYTSCEPCPMCLGAIYWARPSNIYFACTQQDAANAGFDDSFIYREIAVQPSKRLIPALPLMRNEALAVFDKWRAKEDKTVY
jgi:guanine deaminase